MLTVTAKTQKSKPEKHITPPTDTITDNSNTNTTALKKLLWHTKIIGRPFALQRPRTNISSGTVYDPPANRLQKTEWINTLQEHNLLPAHPLESGIELHADMVFAFQRPKTHYTKKSMRLTKAAPKSVYHTQKPDVDNLIKFVFDTLNGHVFADDSQIASVSARKIWLTLPQPQPQSQQSCCSTDIDTDTDTDAHKNDKKKDEGYTIVRLYKIKNT